MGNYWMKEGEEHVIEQYIKNNDIYMGLFTLPLEENLVETMSIEDLTELVEASAGYQRVLLEKENWTEGEVEGIDGSAVYQDYQEFDISGETNPVLGYFLISPESPNYLLSVVYFTDSINPTEIPSISVKPYIIVD
jgi:hypothetical protein